VKCFSVSKHGAHGEKKSTTVKVTRTEKTDCGIVNSLSGLPRRVSHHYTER